MFNMSFLRCWVRIVLAHTAFLAPIGISAAGGALSHAGQRGVAGEARARRCLSVRALEDDLLAGVAVQRPGPTLQETKQNHNSFT